MKLFVKLMIAVLVIGILLPFTLLKNEEGKPLMTFDGFSMPKLSMPKMPDLPKFSTNSGSNPGSGQEEQVIYQWTDAEGNLQFSNSPPPEGVEYTQKGYDPNLNVIQAVEVEPEPSEEENDSQSESQVSGVKGIASPYSPEKIEKLFEDANNIEKIMNQRLKDQEALLGQ